MGESGRVVIITGGSRGIGRAVAFRFAEEKPSMIILHYDPDDSAAFDTVTKLSELGVQAEAYKLDVSSYKDVDALFKGVLSKFGKVDVLVNNAGITRDSLLMRMTEDEWDTVLRVNLKSVFNCASSIYRP
jgi:3-oxoacyl-[acyl-carrier protein] reductase